MATVGGHSHRWYPGMRTAPPSPRAADRYAECLRLLHAAVPPTREQLAKIERAAQAAPYRKRQGELDV